MKQHTKTAPVQNLLTRPGPERITDIEKALAHAAGALPLSAAHARDLPFAVRDLSRLLTAERGELSRSYWAAPRFVSAYLRYFLPWNLFRLAWLLPGLDLGLKSGASVLDLGSGPLTLPLALWCARPDLRAMPLRFVCADVAAKAMDHGRSILAAVAGPESPWQVELLRAPLDRALRQARGREYSLVTAGNVLNEICSERPGAESHPAGQSGGHLANHLGGRLDDLAALAADAVAHGGRMLLVEPGTRLGGKLIALFRNGAIRHGFSPLAPCTHDGPCPMEAAAAHGRGEYSGWCHFIHPVDGAPAALADLTRRAQLDKESLAISCLLLERSAPLTDAAGPHSGVAARAAAGREADELDELEALYREIMDEDGVIEMDAPKRPSAVAPVSDRCRVRVISGPIRLPGHDEPARYACCERGLALVEDARRIPSGAGLDVAAPEPPRRDAKTGALLLRLDRAPVFRPDGPGASPAGGARKDGDRAEAARPEAFRPKAFGQEASRPGGPRSDRSRPDRPRSGRADSGGPRPEGPKPKGKEGGRSGSGKAERKREQSAGVTDATGAKGTKGAKDTRGAKRRPASSGRGGTGDKT